MQRVADLAPALFRASLDEVFRLFVLRGNAPMEWSQLRLALDAAGIKVRHPNDWGALAASLKESGIVEVVGRETAVAASRNGARNGSYRLTSVWWDQACRMAERKGWRTHLDEHIEQMNLI